jgi:hypothetical protein
VKRKILVVLAALAAVYAATASGTEPIEVDAREPSIEHDVITVPTAPRSVIVEHDDATAHPRVPASLDGTEPDGDVSVTISRSTIRFFDYYLTTLGELDLDGVRALVEAEVERRTPDTATEVLALFDRYTTYLQDLRDVRAWSIESYYELALVLQERHFGGDARALFGADNALAARLLRIRRRHRCHACQRTAGRRPRACRESARTSSP